MLFGYGAHSGESSRLQYEVLHTEIMLNVNACYYMPGELESVISVICEMLIVLVLLRK